MSDKYKYGFRVYRVDDNGDLISPYMLNEIAEGHKLGNTYTDNSEWHSMGNDIYDLRNGTSTYVKGKRNGFSFFGVADPVFSVYSLDDLLYNSGDTSVLTDKDEEMLDKLGIAQRSEGEVPRIINPYDNKAVDRKRLYQAMLGRMLDYADRTDGASKVILTGVPLDSIVTVKDMLNNKRTAQRDFANELVTREITPLKEYNTKELRDDFYASKEKDFDPEKLFSERFNIKESDIVSDAAKKTIIKDMSDSYSALLKQRNINDTLIDCSRY